LTGRITSGLQRTPGRASVCISSVIGLAPLRPVVKPHTTHFMILGAPAKPITMPPPKCAKCGADMEEGFIPDEAYGQRQIAIWVAGEPEQGFFFGAKIEGKRAHAIRAFRCTKCGYLEHYALGSP